MYKIFGWPESGRGWGLKSVAHHKNSLLTEKGVHSRVSLPEDYMMQSLPLSSEDQDQGPCGGCSLVQCTAAHQAHLAVGGSQADLQGQRCENIQNIANTSSQLYL